MHFHSTALCMNCHARRTFDTPIPNILILASMCESCGWHDLVGTEPVLPCVACTRMWEIDIQRELELDAERRGMEQGHLKVRPFRHQQRAR